MAFGATGWNTWHWRTRSELALFLLASMCVCHEASCSSAATPTKHHARDTLHPSLPMHPQSPYLIRGGASAASKGKTTGKNNSKKQATPGNKNSKSVIESVTVIKVLQLRFVPWLRLLRTISFEALIVSSVLTYYSIGVPYDHAIWKLLHPNHNQHPQFNVGMPDGYVPSLNDRRIAASLLGDSTFIPPEWFPSLLETSLAVVWGIFYLVIQWFCPWGWQERLRGKVLLPPQDTKYAERLAQGQCLALVVQDETYVIRNNRTKIDVTRQICQVYPVRQKDSKEVSYAFDLRKGFRKYRWGWNPNNGKISTAS